MTIASNIELDGDIVVVRGPLPISFPLQVLVWLLACDHDYEALVAGYRKHDPLPEGEGVYPGPAYLGVPSGFVLRPPAGWTVDGDDLVHGDFRATRDGELFRVGWPDEEQVFQISWALGVLGLES